METCGMGKLELNESFVSKPICTIDTSAFKLYTHFRCSVPNVATPYRTHHVHFLLPFLRDVLKSLR